ncbi:MAG: hypothetical protein Q8900_03015 [Bacillota bacterium]|nr:hypothetical protein [Bacillota bacterium]
MSTFKITNNMGDKVNFSKEIINWCNCKEQILNVISPPYSSSLIFLDVIMKYLKEGKKVLYITGEREDNIEIIETIKRTTDFKNYSYSRNGGRLINSNLLIANLEMAVKIKEKFDLTIIDDIRSFSKYNSCEIMEFIINRCNYAYKTICYSVESIFKNATEIEFPVRKNAMPIPEPRIISTRIDITKDIPYVIYEYILWSMEAGRKIVIFTFDKEAILALHEYLSRFKNQLCNNIISYIKNDSEKKVVLNFAKMKKSILITNDFDEPDLSIHDVDVIVYYADDERYSVKNLLYFCGKVGRGEKSNRGEVIFLGNVVTDSMEKAKNITRHFNKEAWEMKLLEI